MKSGGDDDALCVDELADGFDRRKGRGRQEDQRGATHRRPRKRCPL